MQNNLAAPTTLGEAVAELAAAPDALVVAGGTDVMVDLASGRRRPGDLLTLAWVGELAGWSRTPDEVRLGAALTCTNAAATLDFLPALAQAAAAMGTPQVRNAATLGGNLVSAAGGDLLPVLSAYGATIELASAGGVRELPVDAFWAPERPGARTALRPGELVRALRVGLGPGAAQFCRVAVRGTDAAAWLSIALVLDGDPRAAPAVRLAFVAGGATPVRARAAEDFLADELAVHPGRPPAASVVAEFGRLAGLSAAGEPAAGLPAVGLSGVGDPYRRHAVGVCAGRLLARALAGTAA